MRPVLEVIETGKRVSGVDFKVEFAGRRAGDPAQIVCGLRPCPRHARMATHFNDLETIVAHALALGAQACDARRLCVFAHLPIPNAVSGQRERWAKLTARRHYRGLLSLAVKGDSSYRNVRPVFNLG